MGRQVRVRIDDAAIIRIAGVFSKQAAERAAKTTAQRAARNVIAMGLVNTGALAASFRVRDVTTITLLPKFIVYSTEPTAKYPEFGRGPIVARPGKMLRFKPKGMSTFVFAKKVGPVQAYGFMKKAKQQLRPSDYAR
jgi:hypothetical protein